MKRFTWMTKIIALLTTLTCLAGTLLLPASAPEAAVDEAYEAKTAAWREKLMADDVTTDDFLIGSWVSFYSFEIDSYEYQLDQMAAAGVNFNIFPRNFGGGAMYDADYWNAVEEEYAERNMIYLMNGGMDASLAALGAEYAADKEHCVGYHLIDEPSGAALQSVADMVQVYREADPLRYPFVNLLPSYAGTEWLGGTYYEHVSRFVELTGAENIDYLSHDYYPFADGGNNMGIFADMEVIRAVAYENGKLKTHAFPQSTAWYGMRMPNADEMRWNVYAYLAYGFKALSWFNLVCPGSSDTEGEGFRDSLIYRDGTIRNPELFAAWSELNWEVRGLSDILMNLDTVHAYHVRSTVDGVETLPDDFFLRPVYRQSAYCKDLIISVMEPKEGDDAYIMIFNKNTDRDVECTFTVDMSAGVKWMEYFDPRIGEYIPVELTDGQLTLDYLAGEGKLYRLRYDESPFETETETAAVTEPVTEPATEATTETVTEATTETVTEATTETVTESATESATDAVTEPDGTTAEAPVSKGGCASMVGFSAAAILTAAAAAVVAKKRTDG